MMEAESPSLATENQEGASKKAKTSRVRGKKYLGIRSQVNRDTLYSLPEAITLLKKVSYSSFDGTVELHLVVKKDGMSVTLDLPHATGKQKVVEVASEKTIEKLKSGKVDFDVAVATPDMMIKLSKVAKVLGPAGLMPNPKTDTVSANVKKMVEEIKRGKVSFKNDVQGNIHQAFGKASATEAALMENLRILVDAVRKAKPASAKGIYIKSLTIATTMGPGIKVDASAV
jgi:large subunit ribosomal protein L1